MRSMRLVTLVLSSLLFASSAVAAEPVATALRALEMLDQSDNERWSYTRTTVSEKEGRRVERHDATKEAGSRWYLVSIDGRTPTEAETEKYHREKAKERSRNQRPQEDEDDPDIDRDSIRLVSESAQRLTFAFRPKAGGMLGARVSRSVLGTLVVNRDGEWPERFELRNQGQLSPIPGVRVTEFALVLSFDRDSRTGELLPREFRSRVRGRAFGLKSLDDERVTRFSDYVRAE